jgi:Flp pilus assembly protein TadB
VQIPAPQITSIQVSARSETPDGSTALIVEAATAQRSHRFVIPTSDSVDLARSFSDYAENLKIGEQQDAVASDQAIEFADGQGGGRRLVARFLIGLVVAVVTVAVVAVLLVGIGKI